MSIVLNGDTGITQANQFNSSNTFGFKNRIINGAMVIDQRNAGAAVTVNSLLGLYPVDRWAATGEASQGVFTAQQSTIAPTGFVNSVLVTVTTIDTTLPATTNYRFSQNIEGFNVADLGWGTANAQTVTLSFWVRSSLTGTFGGSVGNNAGTRGYGFLYTINSANTWEQKTITISGDTSGSWLTNNSTGISLRFSLGSNADRQMTANAWSTPSSTAATGATGESSIMGTLNATWYVTGVQLEEGSVNTSFDYRPYTTELQLCQRYYYKNISSGGGSDFGPGYISATSGALITNIFPITMRAAPSALEQTGTAADYSIRAQTGVSNCTSVPVFFTATINQATTTLTTAAVFTNGQGCSGRYVGTAGYLAWSAEL